MIHVVMPHGREGSSTRVRVLEWLDRTDVPSRVSDYLSYRNSSPSHLIRNPRSVLLAERRLRRIAAERPRRLLLHREASPISRGSIERRLLERSEFAVYDFDDALQSDWGRDRLYRRLAPKAPKALLAVRHADRVIAGNFALADWASDYNDDVVVIPSCVSPSSYRQKSSYELSDPPRLGWIGSPNNESYLQFLAPSLREIHHRTGARLTVISTTQPTLGDLEGFIDRVAWSEDVQHRELANLDVAIGPLPDAAYTRGKCGYKLLQYAAAGVPMVASPVGVNRDLLAEFGMPAPVTTDEWVDVVLDVLGRMPAERARLGRRARQVVESGYSYDVWLPFWTKAVGIDDGSSRVPAQDLQDSGSATLGTGFDR
jgi:glycosyltransferase involved in cell wall biosynthesis